MMTNMVPSNKGSHMIAASPTRTMSSPRMGVYCDTAMLAAAKLFLSPAHRLREASVDAEAVGVAGAVGFGSARAAPSS